MSITTSRWEEEEEKEGKEYEQMEEKEEKKHQTETKEHHWKDDDGTKCDR